MLTNSIGVMSMDLEPLEIVSFLNIFKDFSEYFFALVIFSLIA